MNKIIIIVIASVLAGAVYLLFGHNNKLDAKQLQAELKKAYLMQEDGKMGKNLVAAKLSDNQGNSFSTEQLQGEWSLLFFGFTYCPDICITELHLLSKIRQALVKEGYENIPQVYLVSVDPMRDTAKQLNSYVKHFNPNFKALTGEVKQLHNFMKPFGAYYEFSYRHNNKYENVSVWEDIPAAYRESYTVNHTAWTYLINPAGKLVASFPSPHDGANMLHDINLILKNAS